MEHTDKPAEKVTTTPPQQTPTIKFLTHPYWAILAIGGSMIGIVGFILSIYFYYEAKEYPELSFAIYPVKSVLLKKEEASKLSATYEGKQVMGDLTVAHTAIWNNGKKPIKSEQILSNQQSIQISTENNIPILEAKIRNVTRNEVQCTLNNEQIFKGIILVSWRILEQNDGCVIQLIYEGKTDTNIDAIGSIEGQRQITFVKSPSKIKSPEEQYKAAKAQRSSWVALSLFNLLAPPITIIVCIYLFKSRIQYPIRTKSNLVSILKFSFLILVLLFLFLFQFYLEFFVPRDNMPPLFENLS